MLWQVPGVAAVATLGGWGHLFGIASCMARDVVWQYHGRVKYILRNQRMAIRLLQCTRNTRDTHNVPHCRLIKQVQGYSLHFVDSASHGARALR